MSRNLTSNLAMGCVVVAATLAAVVVTSANAAGDDPASGDPRFTSTVSREQVTADLKTPWPGGNPWSGQYNMFQRKSSTTAEQVQGEYLRDREEVRGLTSEDSGSEFIMKTRQLPGSRGVGMGAGAQ